MDNYIAAVFGTDQAASDALHALWRVDGTAEVTVHGAAVLHRDDLGYVHVATKHTDPGMRTAIGVGIGVLLGTFGGPIGLGIGAAAGGLLGLTADAVKSGEHQEAAYRSGLVIHNGESAVIAEVSELASAPIDAAMAALGGKVFRRPKDAIRHESFADDNYADYLYPSDYAPEFSN